MARRAPLLRDLAEPENKDRNCFYSITEDTKRDVIVVAMAIRSIGVTLELTIEPKNYDAGLMLDLIACAE